MWQWRQSSRDEWNAYSDIENALIEDVYKRNGKRVELDNNVMIDLKKGIQFDGNNKDSKRAEIRRLDHAEASSTINRRQRNDRFCSTPKMISDNKSSNTSFSTGDWMGSRFVFEWQMKFVLQLIHSFEKILSFV